MKGMKPSKQHYEQTVAMCKRAEKMAQEFMKPQSTDWERELLEEIANLEHVQWVYWSSNIMHTENISEERIKRWTRLQFTDYSALTENEKDNDRKWAMEIINILKPLFASFHAQGVEEGKI